MKRAMILGLASAAAAGACDGGVPDERPAEALSAGMYDNSTTIRAEKTAQGFFEKEVRYDWTIEKTADPTSVTVAEGATGSVLYTLCAARTAASTTSTIGVRGQICVNNDSSVATQGLTIVDQIQCMCACGQFVDAPGASQVITPGELGAFERRCFDYEIPFTPPAGSTCRNTAKVTITNFAGNEGIAWGPLATAGFSVPSTPTTTETDATASVSDVMTCPTGFTCTPDDPGPFSFTGDGCVEYTTTIRNVSAACGAHATLDNVATLTESSSRETRSDSASVDISTGACSAGCTLTIGFWKNHAGGRGHNADEVTPLLPVLLGSAGGLETITVASAAQAVTLLSNSGNASNGINKLYAQLLGAKLNIESGSSASASSATIAAADAFLATHGAADWMSLTGAQKQQVLSWQSTLDDYNNGLIGPGHCD